MALLVCLLIAVLLPTPKAENGQRLCDTDARLCFTGLCPIDECLTCNDEAVCQTSDPNEVVPRQLLSHMRYLDLTYVGQEEVELTPAMLEYLPLLKHINISGNIGSVAPNTFSHQWNLKWLTITGSNIKSLPNRLFNDSHHLQHLNLPLNQLTHIPVNVFPNIPKVQRIDLSYNPLNGCNNVTIASEFATLQYLDEIRLSGYGSSKELCQNISKDYLSPIRRIRVLDLSESLLFYGDQRILSPLLNLQQLAIDNVAPYKACPASARDLFQNLPARLNNLTFRNWASIEPVNESCILNDNALIGLKKMKRLSLLDARYGDKLFGNVLTPAVFDGFLHLRIIFINWCGIASIEKGTFNAVPRIVSLGLRGNLLGPRVLELYTNGQTATLKTLNLNSVGINIATYHASNLLLAFPLLQLLYLDSNLLQTIPNFGSPKNVSSSLTTLTLNKNLIRHFSKEDGKRLCNIMGVLSIFKAEENQMSDITGISFCPLLKQLHLANNLIGKNPKQNFRALEQLQKLEYLDMSYNKIKSLKPNLFTNLTLLKTLNLANNEITSLPDELFRNSPDLAFLDLSANFLPAFNTSIVLSGLPKLISLYLQANLITVLPPDLLDILTCNITLPKLHNLGLDGNPLMCPCDNYLSTWVKHSSSKIMRVKSITCTTAGNEDKPTRVIDYQPDYFLCHLKTPLIISGQVLAGVIVSVFFALLCYKYRWYISHPKIVIRGIMEKLNELKFHQECKYDAFISYDASSDSDSKWVIDKLIPALEEKAEEDDPTKLVLKLYVVDRDSAVGSPKYTERCRAIENSRKIIILLSNSYLANPDCLSEADLVAGYQLLDGHHCYQPNRILVLILEDLNEEAIKAPVTSLLTENVIHAVDNEAKMKRIWRQVRRFLTKPKYIYRRKRKGIRAAPHHVCSVNAEPSETDPLIQ